MTPRPMNPMAWPTLRPAITYILIAISACPTSATGQNDPKSATACPAAADMNHQHLQGRWQATLQASTPDAEPAPLPEEEIKAELDASPLVDDKKDEG